MHYAIAQDDKNNFIIEFDGEDRKYSDYDSLVAYVDSVNGSDTVYIRDDRMVNADALHDFADMSRDENRYIHARAHSRRNAYRECAYCVRDFISPEEYAEANENEATRFVRPINSRMSHDSCSHESSKNARAKCRRERRNAERLERENADS